MCVLLFYTGGNKRVLTYLLRTVYLILCLIVQKMGKREARNGAAAGGSAPGSGHQNINFDDLQQQLVDLSEQNDGVMAMLNLINETEKAKLSPEDRAIINIAGLITPFMMINKETDANVDFLFCSVYIPPEGSIYSAIDIFDSLESDLIELNPQNAYEVCLLRDFNSHTNTDSDYF